MFLKKRNQSLYCTKCDFSQTEGHTYVDGTCVCGAEETVTPTEPIYDATLASSLTVRGLAITDKFGIDILVNLRGVTQDDFSVVFGKKTVDSTTYDALETPVETTLVSSDAYSAYPTLPAYYFAFSDIYFYEMNIPIDITLNVVRDGKTYYYTTTVNFSDLANDLYSKFLADEKANAKDLSLVTDLLNLAAKCQAYFGEQGIDGNTLSTLELPNTKVDQKYATDYSGITDDGGTRDSGLTIRGFQMLATPTLNYSANLGKTYSNPADLTFTVSYPTKGTNGDENGLIKKVVNGADLSEGDKKFASLGFYYFSFDKMELYDTNKLITFEITAADGSSWKYQSSMQSYLAGKITETGALGDVYKALASFGLSAQAKWSEYA